MKKNFLWSMLTIMVAATMGLGLLSCSDNEVDAGNSSGISGLYYYENGGGSRTAYYFVNDNMVETYGAMTTDPNDTWKGHQGEEFPLRNGWYYWSGNKHTYSYYIIGDIIFIGSDRKMTISGNTLIYDEIGVVLYKWY